jgi:N6-adenosine-specific RNA methylase IME4
MEYASAPFDNLPRGGFGAIYADPPWFWKSYSDFAGHGGPIMSVSRSAQKHYGLLDMDALKALPVAELAASECVLFVWIIWPHLAQAIQLISDWGFTYKTCAFTWVKAHAAQVEMFRDDADVQVGLGFWTRANSEVCLLATRGKPKRLNADVRQGIIEPRREHSRKPSCVYECIERLVAGPYVELFARTTRKGWSSWGNQVGKFAEVA